MAKLSATTVVRHPESGDPVPLLEGTDVPRWAEKLVGDHLIESEPKPAAKRPTARS